MSKLIYYTKKYATILLPFLLLSFAPPESDFRTVHFHSLSFLKTAEAPQPVQMIQSVPGTSQNKNLTYGLLFTYKSRSAKRVQIAGSFTYWKPAAMARNGNGVWYYYLIDPRSDRDLSYKYCVDGIWMVDPKNQERLDDGMGSYLSVARYPDRGEGTQVSYRRLHSGEIEFRIYRPSARIVSLVGDFNHWNPENDLLRRGSDGIWRLRKRMPKGLYRYKYIIDGTWTADLYNSKTGSDDSGQICSIVVIK